MDTINRDTLTDYMKAEGITSREQLAHRMGVDRATVSRMWNGKTSPSGHVIRALKRAFPGRDIGKLIPDD